MNMTYTMETRKLWIKKLKMTWIERDAISWIGETPVCWDDNSPQTEVGIQHNPIKILTSLFEKTSCFKNLCGKAKDLDETKQSWHGGTR